MGTVLLDAVVYTDFGQFDLAWAKDGGFNGDVDRSFRGQVNGLVGAADPGGVYISLSRRFGGSPMRIVLLDSAPEPPPIEYEDVVEVSVRIPAGAEVRWITWFREVSGPLGGLGPGDYRVRVSAKGRDAAQGMRGVAAEGLVDAYLVELWPAGHGPDEILRVGSKDAQYWHREWGSRRQV